ncbi:MAG: TetR/AcrR family transcriptional regulator [Gemmatimonadota bacterium]
MGSAERRRRESKETRQRILDAARDLFVRKGYDATSMRAIADRIEYTPTAIYHHFDNKEALISELCRRDFLALAGAFQRLAEIQDPVERIHRLGEAYVEFGLENPKHYQLMFMAAHRHDHSTGPVKGDPGEDAYAFLRQTVAEAIDGGRFRPEFDDADQVAQMLWAALHGLISLKIAKGEDPWVDMEDVRVTAARARQVLMRGLSR